MSRPELDGAHALHAALVALFVSEPGGAHNPAALSRARALCDAAEAAVDDMECRVAVRGVRALAAQLYSDEGHYGAEAASLRGPEAVRFQIFNALSTFRGRIDLLERRLPSRPDVPAIAAKDLRVLVVEDNPDSAETLRRLLEVCGYAVRVAGSAVEAMAVARQWRPQLILCDIGLPDSDGYMLAEALRDHPATAEARLVALTAYGEPEDRSRSVAAGFRLHLVKPVEPGTLLKVLEELTRSGERALDFTARRAAPRPGV